MKNYRTKLKSFQRKFFQVGALQKLQNSIQTVINPYLVTCMTLTEAKFFQVGDPGLPGRRGLAVSINIVKSTGSLTQSESGSLE